MTEPMQVETPIEEHGLPIQLPVRCGRTVFERAPISFDRWAPLTYLVGPNGTGKTTLFTEIMNAARGRWPKRVKILGTGRLSPLEKSVSQWIGDPATRLFADDNIETIYNQLFGGVDTSHQAFQLLEKRLDLQIRVLGFLRHVFRRSLHFKSTRRGLEILGATSTGESYQLMDECHGLKELITLLTFLYDDTFSVLGIDEPELHLHPQFQRFFLDELRKVAGNPDEEGKKLIFLVTHSPILLELRELTDLTRVVIFSQDAPPKRAQLDALTAEEVLKVRQALPAFHSSQRELLFSNTPIVVEGPTDAGIILNLASKLDLPLGAAGVGIAPMGGKQQFRAFRALLGSFAKPNARFILDLDAALDTNVLHVLDDDPRVVGHLASAGSGERSLTRIVGELKALIRKYLKVAVVADKVFGLPASSRAGELNDRELGMALAYIQNMLTDDQELPASPEEARIIKGKCDLVRSAARAANVLILNRGAIEAYYQTPLRPTAASFDKQQAFQQELDGIWTFASAVELRERYGEILAFIEEAGFLQVPISELAREPIANLVHLMQTEVAAGRIRSRDEAIQSSRAVADGYWHICDLVDLEVYDARRFAGVIQIKPAFGGDAIRFDETTRAYKIAVLGGERYVWQGV